MPLPVQQDERQAIINAALPLLAQGIPTNEIAKPYGITGRTLCNWLISEPDAEAARCHFIAGKLVEGLEGIDCAADPFLLARARESFKAWSWIAERRLPARFGVKQEMNGLAINITIARGEPAEVRVVSDSDTHLT